MLGGKLRTWKIAEQEAISEGLGKCLSWEEKDEEAVCEAPSRQKILG